MENPPKSARHGQRRRRQEKHNAHRLKSIDLDLIVWRFFHIHFHPLGAAFKFIAIRRKIVAFRRVCVRAGCDGEEPPFQCKCTVWDSGVGVCAATISDRAKAKAIRMHTISAMAWHYKANVAAHSRKRAIERNSRERTKSQKRPTKIE